MISSRGGSIPHPDLALNGLAASIVVLTMLGTSFIPDASGRQSPIVFAPQEWSLQGAWTTEVDQGRVTVGMKRAVPVFTLLPQTTPGSRIDALRLRAGVRSDESGVDPRFRVTAFDLDVQKRYKSAVVTLIDVDASGLRDVAATWLGLGFGPGYTAERFNRSFEIRAQAHASLQTVEFGRTSFPGLSDGAADRRTTLEYGARGYLLVRAVERFSLFARGHYSLYVSDADPVWASGRAGVKIFPTPSVSVDVFGGVSAVEGVMSDDSRSEIGVALRYTRREDLY